MKVVDENGTLCPDASDEVRVSASGAVSFKCIANGDATCLESFVEPKMSLFHGMLVATVEAGAEPGDGSLTVSVGKLKSATVGFLVHSPQPCRID